MSTLTAGRGAPVKLGLYLRWITRGIFIACAAFWAWFSIADGLHDAQTHGLMGFIMMLPAALVVIVVLYVVWRWELAGGILLLAVTALGGWLFSVNMHRINTHAGVQPWDVVIGLAIFVLPFLLPAILLLVKCKLDIDRARSSQTSP